VDTSKKSIELLMVARASPTAAVHLVRSPYGVAASERDVSKFEELAPVDRPPFRRAARSALNWLVLNYQAAFATRYLSTPPLRVAYESVIAHPAQQLDRIIELVGLQGHDWDRRGQEFNIPSQHVMNGNPSRYRTGWRTLRSPDMGAGLTAREIVLVRAIVALGNFGHYDRPNLAR
jgi:hypothetical protein